MSCKSDLYGFRMSLFDHGNPEELLLVVRKFKMILASTGTLERETKVQYLCMPSRGEALRQ